MCSRKADNSEAFLYPSTNNIQLFFQVGKNELNDLEARIRPLGVNKYVPTSNCTHAHFQTGNIIS